MISKEEVLNLAELARLQLSDSEVEGLQKDISNILDYVSQVSAVSADASAREVPLNHNVLRPDTPRDASDLLASKEEALRAAFPKRLHVQTGEGDYNVVRKIIQKDE